MLTRLKNILITLLMVACMAAAPAAAEPAKKSVTLSVYALDPFVINNDGEYSGFTIDLWEEIAERLDLDTTYVEAKSVKEELNDVLTGRADAAASALSITEERARVFDFSQPMLNAGLQIMVPVADLEPSIPGIKDFLKLLFSKAILAWLFAALLITIIPAHIIWLLERRSPESIVSRRWPRGVLDSFEWNLGVLAGVIPKFPNRRPAMAVSILWAFVAIIFVAYYIATLTSNLTVQRFDLTVRGPNDLFGKKVCTLGGTTSSQFAKSFGLNPILKADIRECYVGLESGEFDATILDAPILQYFAAHEGEGRVEMAGPVFKEEDYGIVFRNGDPLRKEVDASLLAMREDGTYGSIKEKWFGVGSVTSPR